MMNLPPEVRLQDFDASVGLDRGRTRIVEAIWYAVKIAVFLTAFPWPSRLKAAILRMFGASIGSGVIIRPRVNIHMPWKLLIGDNCWIADETLILNLEPVSIGSNVALSHRVFICTGSHDYKSPAFDYRNRPITIQKGAWIAAGVFVGPGVTVGRNCVATAGSVVTTDLPEGMVCSGNPCRPTRPRFQTMPVDVT